MIAKILKRDLSKNSTGVTIFRGIHAVDGDKPNTPNSDVHYAIVKGNEEGKFSLESGHRTALILREPVDYDNGDREFTLVVAATVSDRSFLAFVHHCFKFEV